MSFTQAEASFSLHSVNGSFYSWNYTPNTNEEITQSGGDMRDGETFSLYYAPGGLTGAASIILNPGGIVCTDINVIDDYNLTATAPNDDFLHGVTYDMVISY